MKKQLRIALPMIPESFTKYANEHFRFRYSDGTPGEMTVELAEKLLTDPECLKIAAEYLPPLPPDVLVAGRDQ